MPDQDITLYAVAVKANMRNSQAEAFEHFPMAVPSIVVVIPAADVTVELGTNEADAEAALAATTIINDSDAGVHTVKPDWSIEAFSAEVAGEYHAVGSRKLPAGVVQSDLEMDLEAEAKVTVDYEPPFIPGEQTRHTAGGADIVKRLAAAATFPTGIDERCEYTFDTPSWMEKTQVTYALWYTMRQWTLSNGCTFANGSIEGSTTGRFSSKLQ